MQHHPLNIFGYNFFIALDAILHNKLRASLTSLGIIFGVASVISMLAVGKGAQQEILEQMKLLGTNNIIVTPVVKQEEGKISDDEQKAKEKKRFSPGLSMADAANIVASIPYVEFASPEIVMETMAIREGLKRSVKLVGVDTSYLKTSEFSIAEGSFFTRHHLEQSLPVCVIGYGVKTRFFATEEPLGNSIKCGNQWLKVVGILKERKITKQNVQHLGIRDYNYDIYTPVSTMLLRFKNRSLVTRQDMQNAAREDNSENQSGTVESKNYHQLDRLVVRISNTAMIGSVAEILSRLLQRRHNQVIDYEITVPENLLRQEQNTRRIFNIVLGAIASISLIVGGIGIMNIMLASVLERTKEIGIRLSIGATKQDIMFQFLSEAVSISITGGIIGIIMGVTMSYVIETMTSIQTIVSTPAVFVAFGVSISIGIIFGIFPARRAASQDPIVSLRYE